MLISDLKDLSMVDRARLVNRAHSDMAHIVPKVEAILKDVKETGDAALLDYTRKFDGAKLESLKVTKEEFDSARIGTDTKVLEALREAANNISLFHEKQLPKDWSYEKDGATLGQMVRPLRRIGCYVPGGRAAYPSSALMTAVTARTAGVDEVVIVTPPDRNGRINDSVLVAAEIAGVDEVYKVGGAQAIGALAYGTRSIKKVDRIVGPGNIYVTAAKKLVSDDVGIDSPAGPSEVLIIADDTPDPKIVAWDMAAQAEHDPNSTSVLVTTSHVVARSVQEEIEALEFPRAETKESLEKNGVILLADTMDEVLEFSNEFAPEHLQIITKDPRDIMDKVTNAGSVFLGGNTPVALGDYASGTNHVLPTGGYARFYSGLSVYDFLKFISYQEFDKKSLEMISETVTILAEAEGLTAHAETVKKRVEK